jgi:hypothetical protein
VRSAHSQSCRNCAQRGIDLRNAGICREQTAELFVDDPESDDQGRYDRIRGAVGKHCIGYGRNFYKLVPALRDERRKPAVRSLIRGRYRNPKAVRDDSHRGLHRAGRAATVT